MLTRDLLHDDEIIILLLRPSLLFIPLSSVGSLMVIAIVTLMLMWMSRVWGALPWIHWTDAEVLVLGIAAAALRLGWQCLEWATRIYILTDRRVIRRRGVLRVNVFESPLRNIQHTSVFIRVRERIFNLGSIGFATAGSDTFEAFWLMIRKPFAAHRVVVETIERYGRRQ